MGVFDAAQFVGVSGMTEPHLRFHAERRDAGYPVEFCPGPAECEFLRGLA
jgi:hypothetical protein